MSHAGPGTGPQGADRPDDVAPGGDPLPVSTHASKAGSTPATTGNTASATPPALPSWGNHPQAAPARVQALHWRDEPLPTPASAAPMLARGNGRSYGDVGLNHGGTVLLTRGLDRVIAFDCQRGILRCEAGILLDRLLELTVPQGWLLPVLPGTAQVTVGGAIGNDIHGKNHHQAGSFGCHVRAFELLRSDGTRLECSPDHHAELFAASIGGLGLTGLITWVELQLVPVPGPWLLATDTRFTGWDAFHELSRAHAAAQYTVAWLDALVPAGQPWRGVFSHGDFAALDDGPAPPKARAGVPFTPPLCLPRAGAVRVLNGQRWRRARTDPAPVHYRRFFFPLDAIGHWNRLYGRRGFVQHQCVLPPQVAIDSLVQIQATIAASGQPPLLAVAKTFGPLASPGLLSFPRPGTTLALDFPFRGEPTRALLARLDAIVAEAGGAVYPAKDAHLSGTHFRQFFPAWQRFCPSVDPAFSSSFWRRVMADAPGMAAAYAKPPP